MFKQVPLHENSIRIELQKCKLKIESKIIPQGRFCMEMYRHRISNLITAQGKFIQLYDFNQQLKKAVRKQKQAHPQPISEQVKVPENIKAKTIKNAKITQKLIESQSIQAQCIVKQKDLIQKKIHQKQIIINKIRQENQAIRLLIKKQQKKIMQNLVQQNSLNLQQISFYKVYKEKLQNSHKMKQQVLEKQSKLKQLKRIIQQKYIQAKETDQSNTAIGIKIRQMEQSLGTKNECIYRERSHNIKMVTATQQQIKKNCKLKTKLGSLQQKLNTLMQKNKYLRETKQNWIEVVCQFSQENSLIFDQVQNLQREFLTFNLQNIQANAIGILL